MLYELSADGYTVGVFPTEAAAPHNASVYAGRVLHYPRMDQRRRIF